MKTYIKLNFNLSKWFSGESIYENMPYIQNKNWQYYTNKEYFKIVTAMLQINSTSKSDSIKI